jgi:hypothetical protein
MRFVTDVMGNVIYALDIIESGFSLQQQVLFHTPSANRLLRFFLSDFRKSPIGRFLRDPYPSYDAFLALRWFDHEHQVSKL